MTPAWLINFVDSLKKAMDIPAVWIDGALYLAIAFFAALAAVFASDEAAKYIPPEWLFWLRSFCSVTSATMLAAKLFRSTAFAEHKAAQIPPLPSSPTDPKP